MGSDQRTVRRNTFICVDVCLCLSGVLSMKVGDDVRIHGKPEYGRGKIVRFYANHGTVLVQFEKEKELSYCDYSSLEKVNESR